MSAPTRGTPNSWKLRMVEMLLRRSSGLEALSPSQWAAYPPEPGKVERDKTKGRFPWLADSRACRVAMDSVRPMYTWG